MDIGHRGKRLEVGPGDAARWACSAVSVVSEEEETAPLPVPLDPVPVMDPEVQRGTTDRFGLVVVLGTFAVGDSSSRDTAAVLGSGVVLIFLFAHWVTVKRATS
jgi:hypothetical protein